MLDNLRYLVIDTETLEDYFSLQYKNEKGISKVYECYNDNDIHKLYALLTRVKRPMYCYSIDYDKIMINALCKFVESKTINICYHLRQVSNYIINHKIDYFRLNKLFWTDCYFKIKESDIDLSQKEIWDQSILKCKQLNPNQKTREFIDLYQRILGKSKVFKSLIINSIPKINFYYTVKNDKSLQMTISLKKLQLIYEGYNIKFDFNKYTKIADIKKDGLYDTFIEYSLNDVNFLDTIFKDKPLKDITKRIYAVQAVKQINPDIEISDIEIYSENDTALITKLLSIDKPNKVFTVDYTKHIKTNYKQFNDFVKFVSENNNLISKDRELKETYCSKFKKEYITDDYTIVNDNVDLQINSFDTLIINNTSIKFGLGGVHGAIPSYISENLLHLDYTSQYPSIILQYKELFKNIINVDLYEAVYNMRIESKPKLKLIENEKGIDSPEYKELLLIVEGLKLILNTAYGLINSNFELPISFKPLGRFICLKGQSLLLNLAYKLIKYNNDISLVNVNTDGIILKLPENCNIDQLIKEDIDGYFVLGVDKIKKIIQRDVNSYLKIMENESLKTKGAFNLKIKQHINKNEQLSVLLQNAIRLINNQSVQILPVYFDIKWINKEEKAYYLTNSINGSIAIKNTVKPQILSIDNEMFYFTDNKDLADLSLYQKYSRIIMDRILTFSMTNTEKNLPFIENTLIEDTEENNKSKKTLKLKLTKLFNLTDKNKNLLGFVGFKGDTKTNSYINGKPIKPLIHYTMTKIQNSTYCKGFSLTSGDKFLIIDVDIFDKHTNKPKIGFQICNLLINKLKEQNTFECWNDKTIRTNRKFIFKCNDKILIKSPYNKYIEILTQKATILTLDEVNIKYDCNWIEPIEFNLNEFKEYIS